MAAVALALLPALQAAAPWGTPIMQPGIAAVSCAVPVNAPTNMAFSFGVFDFRNPLAPDYGPFGFSSPLWNPPLYHHPSWTVTDIGNVYGITIDADGDMYVAAHGLYSKTWSLFSYYHRYGNLGGGATSLLAAGTIYKIDRNTGAAAPFAVIPGQQTMSLGAGFNSGPGLGNIAYDRINDQFFATSLEDGIIYRISNAGVIVQTFDPLTADTGAPGLPPATERLWGIEVSRGAVHYAVWNTGNSTSPGKIRRVNILSGGPLSPGSDIEILTVPASPMTGGAQFVPVADITFSADGTKMVLGERTMVGSTDSYNHASRVHIAELIGSTWTVTKTLETGNSWGDGEAYGGVAYGPENSAAEQLIWMTTADSATTAGPHGIQGVRPADFPLAGSPSIVTNSYRVPFDPGYTTSGPDFKGSGGDVEIMQPPADDCATIAVADVHCPRTNGEPFTVSLNITNLSTSTVHYVWFTPCPTSDLPAGAVTTQPLPAGVVPLPTPLGTNMGTALTINLPGNLSGQTVCFRMTLLDESGRQCCTQKICVPLPLCDCAAVLDRKIDCEVSADGTIKYTITLTIQNLTHLSSNPYPIAYVSFLPPLGFNPTYALPTPNPILPGAIGTITACYYGTPGPLCFSLGLHDDSLELCCAPDQVCLVLPDCPGGGSSPDTCAMEEKVPCCPPDGLTTINFTVCNNSAVPRTYNWTAMGVTAPGCTQNLLPSHFLPNSGTLGPIPPGGCLTVPIQIRCENFKPGDCAGFQICASYDATVPPLCCEGIVYRPTPGDPVVKHDVPDPIPVGGSSHLTFTIENPTDTDLTVDLSLRDAIGILGYSDGTGAAPTPSLTTRLVLLPRATQSFSVDAFRFDDGSRSPDFTRVQLWTRIDGTVNALDEPALIFPVRLLPSAAGGGFALSGIRLERTPEPQVAITLVTTLGYRYRLEEARDVTGPWSLSDCSTPDTEIDAEGYFLGTGKEVTCLVPCNTVEAKIFFRVSQHP